MTRPRRRALAVTRVAVVLLFLHMLARIPSAAGLMLYVGVTDTDIAYGLAVLFWATLVVAFTVAAVSAARQRSSRSRVITAALALGALASIGVTALLVLLGLVGAGFKSTYTRFDAPDGTRYLLGVQHAESGSVTVYRGVAPLLWTRTPAFATYSGTPGTPPCSATATDTTITVRCSDGSPWTTRR